MQGSQKGVVELSTLPSSLAIAHNRNLVLVGDEAGYLWGYPQDLKTLSLSKQVQNGAVHAHLRRSGWLRGYRRRRKRTAIPGSMTQLTL